LAAKKVMKNKGNLVETKFLEPTMKELDTHHQLPKYRFSNFGE
jgi:hypothetical protein